MTGRPARRWPPRRSPFGTGQGFDRGLIAPLVLGSLLNPVNSSMIAVSLVPIGVAFGAPPSMTVWLVSALYLATAVGQPVVGRLVDRFGPRPLYLAGAALVGVAGAIGTAAPDLAYLIFARVLIGLGTSAAYPAAMYLIRSESARTGWDTPAGVLTALVVAAQTTVVIGPALGGVLVWLGGWRTIFAVNVPLAVVCLLLGRRRLPRNPTQAPEVRDERSTELDGVGMLLFAAMLTSLLLFLMAPRAANWYLLPVGALLGAGLAVRELRSASPFLDLRLVRGNRPLLATYLRQTLSYTVAYSVIYGYTQWLEATRHLSEIATGLVLLPLALVGVVVATTTGRRRELRGKLVVGSLCMALASVVILSLHPRSPLWLLIAVVVISGVPQGLNGLANQNALYWQAPDGRVGTSAGLLRTAQYLGALVSSALIAGSFSGGAHTGGLHSLGLVMLGCALLLLAVTLLDPSLRRLSRPAE
ncbi:MFS transporter [Streptomyces sp. TP-A0874]|uniref:MFS transporter n=1 Tax=Streptomyces sp. TP-A0874 TaxID=549819 RepID=UPI000852DF25|nr:MFS transporter [Streptomyces sp. TP-A0874]